jgi:hypothetical protein
MYRPTYQLSGFNLLVIAAIALAVIVALRPGEPQRALVSRWQPPLMITLPEGVGAPTAPAPITGSATVFEVFRLGVDDGLFADQREPLAAELQAALGYVTQRFGNPAAAPFDVAVKSSAGCALHGLAYTDQRHIEVYACDAVGRGRAVNIMAHEFVHQLAADRYGPPHLSADLILLEGTATWGAGKYWLGGHADFRSFVREQRAAGISLPLATHYAGRSMAEMNALYYQWASFVEYLLERYGRERFDALYISGGDRVPGGANYPAIYGRDLGALEAEWALWVDG